MSIDMYLSNARSQNSSLQNACHKKISSFERVVSSLNSFTADSSLKGQAYTSAKSYYSGLAMPTAKAGVLMYNEMMRASQRYVDGYVSEVDGKSHKESELIMDIQQASSHISQLQEVKSHLKKDKTGIMNMMFGGMIRSQIGEERAEIRRLTKILNKLRIFNGKSTSYFASYESAKQVFERAVNQMSNSVSSTGGFSMPPASQLTWVEGVNSKYINFTTSQSSVNKTAKELGLTKPKYMSELDYASAVLLIASELSKKKASWDGENWEKDGRRGYGQQLLALLSKTVKKDWNKEVKNFNERPLTYSIEDGISTRTEYPGTGVGANINGYSANGYGVDFKAGQYEQIMRAGYSSDYKGARLNWGFDGMSISANLLDAGKKNGLAYVVAHNNFFEPNFLKGSISSMTTNANLTAELEAEQGDMNLEAGLGATAGSIQWTPEVTFGRMGERHLPILQGGLEIGLSAGVGSSLSLNSKEAVPFWNDRLAWTSNTVDIDAKALAEVHVKVTFPFIKVK